MGFSLWNIFKVRRVHLFERTEMQLNLLAPAGALLALPFRNN